MSSPTYSTYPWDTQPCIVEDGTKKGTKAVVELIHSDEFLASLPSSKGELTPTSQDSGEARCSSNPSVCCSDCPELKDSAKVSVTRKVELARRILRDSLVFSTMTASARLNQSSVKLEVLARSLPGGNCIFDPRGRLRFEGNLSRKRRAMSNMMSMYLKVPSTGTKRMINASVFSNGMMSISGAKNYAELLYVVDTAILRIRKAYTQDRVGRRTYAVSAPDSLDLGLLESSDENGIRIEMGKMDFDLAISIKLEAAFQVLTRDFDVSYEPEIFAGLKIKSAQSPYIIIVLYSSGKGYMTCSSRTMLASKDASAELRRAYDAVCSVLWSNKAHVVNLAYSKRICKS
eukprot:758249-Hanusia_phi.AAC.2